MIEELFSSKRLERVRRSWIRGPIERYVDWLVGRRYARSSIKDRLSLLVHFGEFGKDSGAVRVDDLPRHVAAFVDHWVERVPRRSSRTRITCAQKVRASVEQMLRLAVPGFRGGRWPDLPWPFRTTAPGFLVFLKEERGLSSETIRIYGHHLRKLEAHMAKAGLTNLAELTPAALTGFLVDVGHRIGLGSVKGCSGVIRTFLRYSERERLVTPGLARSIDSPRLYRLAHVPRSISWSEASRVLAMVDRASAVGIRDYAMLLLLLTYGLRAREVAALALDDIDRAHGRLQIPRRKGGHWHAYRLVAPVADALVDYLRHARAASSERRVLLQVKAPYTPLRFIDVSRRVGTLLRRAGIAVRRPGSHTLRHTCVQRLIDADFSLKDIGDFVGHRTPESTQIYSKVAVESLRGVARDRGEVAP